MLALAQQDPGLAAFYGDLYNVPFPRSSAQSEEPTTIEGQRLLTDRSLRPTKKGVTTQVEQGPG